MLKRLGLKLKEQKGFTLLELLAVIVILGVIAAIAIPSITNVISSSKQKATVADALEIISAAKIYNAEFPSSNSTTGDEITHSELAPYLDRAKDNSFSVYAFYNTTSKTYTYKIKNHDVSDTTGGKTPIIAADTDGFVDEKTLSAWSN